jgi:hypothetical protein
MSLCSYAPIFSKSAAQQHKGVALVSTGRWQMLLTTVREGQSCGAHGLLGEQDSQGAAREGMGDTEAGEPGELDLE